MVAVGPSGVHPCLGEEETLQHPRPSSLHCRCRMAEDRPHATEPCPRSSGQAHGQQACPELRLTGKRPLCRRFKSTTRGPTPQLTSCSRPSLPPLGPGPRGPRTTLHALPSLGTALRSPAAHFFSPTPPRLLRPYLAAELNPQPCAAQVSYVILGALRRTLYHVLAFPNLLSGSVRGGRE